MSRTITSFNDHGSINDLPRTDRPNSASNEETSLNVMLSIIQDLHNSIHRVSEEHDVSKSSVYNILKRAKFHSFKVKLVHKLNEDDFDRRVEF